MLICRLADSNSSSVSDLLSGHFLLSPASEHGLILRSVASSELLLPLTEPGQDTNQPVDQALADSLAQVNRLGMPDHEFLEVVFLLQIRIEEDEYNPLYYEARKSKITLDTNLI